MSSPTISLIAAVAHNYVIGLDGELPWKLSSDMKWFKKNTVGKPVIFGRKTFESMGALKDRENIVVTSSESLEGDDDVTLCTSLDLALEHAGESEEIMILGGAGIYEEAILVADRFYLTVVHATPEGDTFFPKIIDDQWRVSYHRTHPVDKKNPIAHSYLILERFQYGEVETDDEFLPSRYRPVTGGAP